MKLAIIAILVFFVSATLHAEPVWLYGFTCEGGDTYEFTISREQYDKQPTIHIGPQELPISPGTAAKIAFDAIKPLLPPDQFSRLRCGDIQIHQIPNPDSGNLAVNTKRWYYHVSFRTDAGETFMTPSILYDRVLVLMDGRPVLLKKKNG